MALAGGTQERGLAKPAEPPCSVGVGNRVGGQSGKVSPEAAAPGLRVCQTHLENC